MARGKDKDGDAQLGLEQLMEAAEPAAAPAGPKVYGVGEIVRLASRTLEERYRGIWVEGEVSNLRRIASGHVFFSLKEASAQLSGVMFRSDARRARFQLKDGDAVRCRGSLRIYEAQGRFQLYVDRVEPVGLGELMLAFAELKARLTAEGLFDPQRKEPLPPAPRVVGVVTSSTGAALRDIIQVAHSRGAVRIIVSPTPVQGADAPPRIVAALQRLARLEQVDVAIVGRGGGSLEDLWCFNDERVARAVAAFPKPIVSAVGHEVDFTLCDFAADARAATPSAAAELVVPDHRAQHTRLIAARDRLHAVGRRLLDRARLRLTSCERRLGDPRPLLLDARVSLDGLTTRLYAAGQQALRTRRRRLASLREGVVAGHPRARLTRRRADLERLTVALSARLEGILAGARERSVGLRDHLGRVGEHTTEQRRRQFGVLTARLGELSPLRVLSRGYAVAVNEQGRAVRTWDQVETGDPLRLRLAAGELDCEVTDRHPPPESDAPPDEKNKN